MSRYKDINICFLDGKVISKIEFNFFYNSRMHNSMVSFYIKTGYTKSSKNKSKQVLLVIAYDEKADAIYRKYKIGSNIHIIGKITPKYIQIEEFE